MLWGNLKANKLLFFIACQYKLLPILLTELVFVLENIL